MEDNNNKNLITLINKQETAVIVLKLLVKMGTICLPPNNKMDFQVPLLLNSIMLNNNSPVQVKCLLNQVSSLINKNTDISLINFRVDFKLNLSLSLRKTNFELFIFNE